MLVMCDYESSTTRNSCDFEGVLGLYHLFIACMCLLLLALIALIFFVGSTGYS